LSGLSRLVWENMVAYYVNMQDKYVNMQHHYADIQEKNVIGCEYGKFSKIIKYFPRVTSNTLYATYLCRNAIYVDMLPIYVNMQLMVDMQLSCVNLQLIYVNM
jgi:hypothetical protein